MTVKGLSKMITEQSNMFFEIRYGRPERISFRNKSYSNTRWYPYLNYENLDKVDINIYNINIDNCERYWTQRPVEVIDYDCRIKPCSSVFLFGNSFHQCYGDKFKIICDYTPSNRHRAKDDFYQSELKWIKKYLIRYNLFMNLDIRKVPMYEIDYTADDYVEKEFIIDKKLVVMEVDNHVNE